MGETRQTILKKRVKGALLQCLRVMREPAKYVKREDERARRFGAEMERKLNEFLDRFYGVKR